MTDLEKILNMAWWGDYQKADGTWSVGISNREELLQALKAREEGIALRARIAAYKQIEENWHHNDVKQYILDLHDNDIRRLTQLQGEATEGDGR